MAIIWAPMPYQIHQFSGEDTNAFLQGQLTQDIDKIQPGLCHYGAYCNHKGQMLANFLLSRDESGAILARVHKESAPDVIKRLQMFILRASVKIALLPLQCVAGNQAMATEVCRYYQMALPSVFQTSRRDGVSVYALPGGYYEATYPSDDALSMLVDTPVNTDSLEKLRLTNGHFQILAKMNERLLPQQTTLAAWGGINYEKGCYIGQEVIARNKYLGVVKKGLAIATMDPSTVCQPSSPIVREGKIVGQVIESHTGKLETTCLAIMPLGSLGQAVTVDDKPAVFHSIIDSQE